MDTSPYEGPPLLETPPCSSLREAGRQHGLLAAARIQKFLKNKEISEALAFVAGTVGSAVLADLQADNRAAFPEYAEEIEGIAEGANVAVEAIWTVSLLAEIQAMMGMPIGKRAEHCSDLMLRGEGKELWHGHNEDWTKHPDWHETVYFVKYNALPGSTFVPVLAFCYPGMIPGFAMTWSANGIIFTQNSLFPPTVRRRGLGCTFVARKAGEEKSLDRALQWLVAPGQALGCSVNLVELPKDGKLPRACNVEVHGAGPATAVSWLEERPGSSLLHFNVYNVLQVGNANNARNSWTRHARATELMAVAPGSAGGAASMQAALADTGRESSASSTFPLFRKTTMCSWMLDVGAGLVVVWKGRPGHVSPLHTWETEDFLQRPSRSSSKVPSRNASPILTSTAPLQVASLPLQMGMHQVDLRLRQELSKGMQKALKGSNCNPGIELSELRKELIRKVRMAEMDPEEAVQAFRKRIDQVLNVWPQAPLDSDGESKNLLKAKTHEVDLLLRKAVGQSVKRLEGSIRPEALVTLRKEIVSRVRMGELASEDAEAAFQKGMSHLLTEPSDPSFLEPQLFSVPYATACH